MFAPYFMANEDCECCEAEETIEDCTAFLAWFNTLTEAHINVNGVSNNGCTNCVASLEGDWILDEPGGVLVGACDGSLVNTLRLSTLYEQCTSGLDTIQGPFKWGVTASCGGTSATIRAVQYYSSTCAIFASRTISLPATVSDLESGTMTNTGSGTTPACHISGDVPYELFV